MTVLQREAQPYPTSWSDPPSSLATLTFPNGPFHLVAERAGRSAADLEIGPTQNRALQQT